MEIKTTRSRVKPEAVSIKLRDEIHSELKKRSAVTGVRIQDMVNTAITEWLAKGSVPTASKTRSRRVKPTSVIIRLKQELHSELKARSDSAGIPFYVLVETAVVTWLHKQPPITYQSKVFEMVEAIAG